METFLVGSEARGVEAWIELEKGETAAEGVVNHGETTVGSVHEADDVDVFRDTKFVFGIEEGELGAAFVALDEHKEFAENFAEVAAVDFVDDEIIRVLGVGAGGLAEVVEDAFFE